MTFHKFFSIPIITVIGLIFFISPAHAWMVLHGFTDPCHETMALQSYNFVLRGMDLQDVHLPQDAVSRKIFKTIGKELDIECSDDIHLFNVGSMILGVRQPDTDGHSMLDFNRARAMHMAEDTQSNHGLRTRYDDGEEGDKMAILATRRKIEKMLEKARFYATGPLTERYIRISHPIEYYGDIKITVYAPAYYLGIAMHTFQDTFSHMIRSDDVREIHHVMNYIDASTVGHDEKRDGLAHSLTMDDCFGAASEIAETATIATSELMRAFIADIRVYKGEATDQVLDDWLQLKPGCTMENNYCDSRWLEIARREQTEPLFEEAFDCSMHGHSKRPVFPWVLGMILLGLRRKWSRRRWGKKRFSTSTLTFWLVLLAFGSIATPLRAQDKDSIPKETSKNASEPSNVSIGTKTEVNKDPSEKQPTENELYLSPLSWSPATFHTFTHSFYLLPEVHGSIFNDAKDDRTSIGDTFGYALKAGYRWTLLGVFLQVEQNFWTSTELNRSINQGALNVGLGFELNYLHGYVRSSLAMGSSTLLFDTMIDEAGETGVFVDFRPLALRWPMTDFFALVLDPLSFALVVPVLDGFPLVMMEYRTVIANEFNF